MIPHACCQGSACLAGRGRAQAAKVRDLALAKLKTVEKQKADVERVRDELRCRSCSHTNNGTYAAVPWFRLHTNIVQAVNL
jgi:hypothetical protein